MIKRISEHLTYEQAIYSDTAIEKGIDNTPTEREIQNLRTIAINVFEPLVATAGVPIKCSSGFRAPLLNIAVGGSEHSQHCKGQALDLKSLKPRRFSNAEIFNFIRINLSYDQLIWEYGDDKEPAWVHVSYVSGEHNRRETLIKKKGQPYKPFK